MTITENFERFKYFNFKTNFFKNEKLFTENWSTVFKLKVIRLKRQHFHTKLLCHKPVLRQIEWGVQDGSITKNGVLPVTTSFFREFCFSLLTPCKELI